MPMIFAVGQPHPMLEGRRIAAGVVLSISPEDFGICAILDQPTPREIHEYQGHLRIGLVPAGAHTFFLIMKPGDLHWTDAPYTLGSVPPDQRSAWEPRDADRGYFVHFELCDLTTRRICALRAFTVTPAFSTVLESQIVKLYRNLPTFSLEKHKAEVAEFYRRYPDPNRMTDAAVIIETAGMQFPQ